MLAYFRLPIFCPRRRFAAYHEQEQAPAPRAASSIGGMISGCLNMECQRLAGRIASKRNAILCTIVATSRRRST